MTYDICYASPLPRPKSLKFATAQTRITIHDTKKLTSLRKINYTPCHNTSSIVNLSEKSSGKKRWQLANFLSN